jgi:hypothetical protein
MKILVEVWDASPDPPVTPPPAGYKAGYFTLETGGKVVWTAVPYEPATIGPLPKRTPSPVAPPDPRVEHVTDTELLDRLREGLWEL